MTETQQAEVRLTQTENLLRQHSIETARWFGALMALEVVSLPDRTLRAEWIDVSGWSRRQVWEWLGY